MTDTLLLQTIKNKGGSRPPVWFMRQAGRILPSYRKLKEQHSFRELISDPDKAAEVTLLPVHDLGVDAAILFSDILVIPEAMGMELDFTDHGPVFSNPLKMSDNPVAELSPNPDHLHYIYQTIDRVMAKRPPGTPLIGFCGAPLTTFCYMAQGLGQGQLFPDAIQMIYKQRKEVEQILDGITELSIEYALQQVKHGIDVFQLFDTHAGILPFNLYQQLILPRVERILSAVRQTGTPVIFLPKDLGAGIVFITAELTDVLSVDWQSSIEQVQSMVDPELCLQGNIDPRLLKADQETIKQTLDGYLEFGRRNPRWIINLGHGVLPDTPLENVQMVVDWAKNSDWKRSFNS